MDLGAGEGFDQLVEAADLVLDEDRELTDRSEIGLLGKFGGHRKPL
jgi:hypothetical protein